MKLGNERAFFRAMKGWIGGVDFLFFLILQWKTEVGEKKDTHLQSGIKVVLYEIKHITIVN